MKEVDGGSHKNDERQRRQGLTSSVTHGMLSCSKMDREGSGGCLPRT